MYCCSFLRMWMIILYICLKGQLRCFEHRAPFLVCLGWNRVVNTEFIYYFGPVSSIWLISNAPACFTWLAMCIQKHPLTFFFWNVKFIEWLVVFFDVPNQGSWWNTVSVVFYLAFCKLNGNRIGIETSFRFIYKSRQGRFEVSQILETGPIFKISKLTTLFHPRQTRKGAQCSKYLNCSFKSCDICVFEYLDWHYDCALTKLSFVLIHFYLLVYARQYKKPWVLRKSVELYQIRTSICSPSPNLLGWPGNFICYPAVNIMPICILFCILHRSHPVSFPSAKCCRKR
jgi:hypothetical protein